MAVPAHGQSVHTMPLWLPGYKGPRARFLVGAREVGFVQGLSVFCDSIDAPEGQALSPSYSHHCPSLGLAPSSTHGLSQTLAPSSPCCGFRLSLLDKMRGRPLPTDGPYLQEALWFPQLL